MVGTEKRPDSTVMIRDSAMQPNRDAASAHDKPVIRHRWEATGSLTASSAPRRSTRCVAALALMIARIDNTPADLTDVRGIRALRYEAWCQRRWRWPLGEHLRPCKLALVDII
jgi:hypothetical protein